MTKKNILIFYLFSFLMGFYLANGTTVLFERVLGFSFAQIFTLGAVYMLMFIIFEVPSGAMADLLGRKRSIFLGCLILSLGALATGLSNNFLQVFLSFFLWALGFSLISGADEALLYDKLQDERLYSKVYGRSRFWFLGGTAMAAIFGPYFYSLHFRLAYLLSAIPFFLAGLSILFFKEKFIKSSFTLKVHWKQIKQGLQIAFQNKFIFWATGVMALTFAVWYNLSNSYQPFLQNVGFSIREFSYILPAFFIGEALGGMLGSKLLQKFGEKLVFQIGLLTFGLSVGMAGIFHEKNSLLFLLGYSFVLGILRLAISLYGNRRLEAQNRATVISVQGMIATLTAALTLFLFGFLTDRLGINYLLIILGTIVLILSSLLLLVKPKDKAIDV